MKTILISTLLAVACALPAHAGTLHDSGPALGTDGYCDSIILLCGNNQFYDPSTAWTIYSSFALGSAATMTGASYGNDFLGNDADYVRTNWSIWTADPAQNFAAGPAYAGSVVGTLTMDGEFTTVSFGGLDIALAPGSYYFGYQNVLAVDALVFYAKTHGSDFHSSQSDQLGTFYNPDIPLAAFTIDGTFDDVSDVPEPATWALAIVGFGAIGSALRRPRQQIA